MWGQNLFLLSPYGRMSLGQYWRGFGVPYAALMAVATAFDLLVLGPDFVAGRAPHGVRFWLWSALLIPSAATLIQRLHDREMTGSWALMLALPLVAAIPFNEHVFGVEAFTQFSLFPALGGLGMMLTAAWVTVTAYVLVQAWLIPGTPGENAYGSYPE